MSLRKGQKVSWNTSQGTTHGKVVEKHTKDFTFEKQQFRASDDDPVYVVESDKTGAKAAHHEKALSSRD